MEELLAFRKMLLGLIDKPLETCLDVFPLPIPVSLVGKRLYIFFDDIGATMVGKVVYDEAIGWNFEVEDIFYDSE